jgi:uncharacterized MAPEG superfamily protein
MRRGRRAQSPDIAGSNRDRDAPGRGFGLGFAHSREQEPGMTIAVAYWSVLVAALLPYVWTTVAKSSGERYDNRDPRGWIARQSNPRVQWANSAQLNAFEAFAPFAAGVVFAQFAGVPEMRIAFLAIVFVVFRVLHGVIYSLGLKHSLRSLAWFVAFACVVALFVLAALRVGHAG